MMKSCVLQALKVACQYAGVHTFRDTGIIKENIINWNEYTGIEDIDTLAALGLYGKYDPSEKAQAIKERYFPIQSDLISCMEIEESYRY